MQRYHKLKDYVYQYIVEQLNQGLLNPGDRITEKEIETKMGLSRTPIREALIELSTEGILINEPRKGFRVNALSVKRTRDLYELTGLLEGYIAKCNVGELTDGDYRSMEALIVEIDGAIEAGDLKAYYAKQAEFHWCYLRHFNNDEMLSLLERTRRQFVRRYFNLAQDSALMFILKEMNEQHRKILSLFRSGDAAAVQSFIQNIHWSRDSAIISILNNIA